MGFLKRLFSREDTEKTDKGYSDPSGIYLYVKCDRCGTCVKLRVDKKYDLENLGDSYSWHKTIVDSRCFRRMQTVVHFDRNYRVTGSELEGGKYITETEYREWLAAKEAAQNQPIEPETNSSTEDHEDPESDTV